ncbi:hypothetical protein J132_05116 [Termitomyces sp. J132]|nr:hypothetical protein C0989_001971 [Termitomyces sp. Mn162]KNZ77582.1 hypothetical protein J132_05116 [Termitomyces sp. J132]
MDSSLSYEIVTQLLDISMPSVRTADFTGRPRRGRSYDAEKRYATYFPSRANFDACNVADDQSTWEFSAPVSSFASSSSAESCSSASTTAAQEIALQYRTGTPSKAILLSSSSTSVSLEESDNTWKTAVADTSITSEFEVPPPIPKKDHLVTAQCKSFRDQELSDSLQEALDTMKQDGKDESGPFVCHRPGCRDMLRNIEAFMYHLHIHNIHDE